VAEKISLALTFKEIFVLSFYALPFVWSFTCPVHCLLLPLRALQMQNLAAFLTGKGLEKTN
jgi:hypothetical protein